MTDSAVENREEEGNFENYFNELNDIEDDIVVEDEPSQEPSDEVPDEIEQLRQLNAKLKQERDHFEHSFKSQVGRVSALQKKIDSELETKQVETKPDIDESLRSVMEDYPDIAKPIIDYLERKYNDIGNKLAPMQQSEDHRQAQEQQRYIDYQLNLMDTSIPDWRETIAKPEYEEWLNKQPAAIRQMKSSTDAEDYQYLINSFMATQQVDNTQLLKLQGKSQDLTSRRQAKLAASVQIPSSGASKKSTAPDDFNSAWEYYANKK